MPRVAPQREKGEFVPCVLCLQASFSLPTLSLPGRNFRGGLRGGFQQNIHQFSRCALLGSWSPPIGQCQGRGSLALQLVLVSPA